ncbi:hypothetical protein C440_09007 [Haloferax mucosum ATCC BAA-1512]|uniref:Uncharacterized protein n=1 Tax=Haloferax mucosum ATCC BAA-1512 TaxID=662479 RepID=M0IIB1_9EURY|nr:hypothetical protein [Haloferax mucosum]ELZ95204.1 hypothetical protein C440_09007 [Haloferax mucosum ATCC BAA-1512]
MHRIFRIALAFGAAAVVALPLGLFLAPDPTGFTPFLYGLGITAVLGLPALFGLRRVSS